MNKTYEDQFALLSEKADGIRKELSVNDVLFAIMDAAREVFADNGEGIAEHVGALIGAFVMESLFGEGTELKDLIMQADFLDELGAERAQEG